MEKLNIKIKGMHCEGCEKRIENALGDIKGVKNVEADYKSGTAVVETKSKIDNKEIEDFYKKIFMVLNNYIDKRIGVYNA